MNGIATAAMALPIPVRIRHTAKSRRRATRGIFAAYDKTRRCDVKKTFWSVFLEQVDPSP